MRILDFKTEFARFAFLALVFLFAITTGLFTFAYFVNAQSQYHLPNPLYLTLRNITTNQEYGNTGQGVRAALTASSTDTLLFKWAKVEGAEAYWYSSDLTEDSRNRGTYLWNKLDTPKAQDRGTYYTLEMPASTIPEGAHWFQITACPLNGQGCSKSREGYDFLYVWVRVGGAATLPPIVTTANFRVNEATSTNVFPGGTLDFSWNRVIEADDYQFSFDQTQWQSIGALGVSPVATFVSLSRVQTSGLNPGDVLNIYLRACRENACSTQNPSVTINIREFQITKAQLTPDITATTTRRVLPQWARADGVILSWQAQGLSDTPRYDYEITYPAIVRALKNTGIHFHITGLTNAINRARDFFRQEGIPESQVTFYDAGMADAWARNWGPFTAVDANGRRVLLDTLDGRHDSTVRFTRPLAESNNIPWILTNVEIEGGDFITDGRGGCAVSERAVSLNSNRLEEAAQIMKDQFGCERFIITEGLLEEATQHNDMFAQFLNENTAVVGEYVSAINVNEAEQCGRSAIRGVIGSVNINDIADVRRARDILEACNARLLNRNAQRFREAGYQVERIPMPHIRLEPSAGFNLFYGPISRIFRTYANSLIINGKVLLPSYTAQEGENATELSGMERRAREVYERYEYEVIPILSDGIIQRQGAVMCITNSLFLP